MINIYSFDLILYCLWLLEYVYMNGYKLILNDCLRWCN